MADITGIGWVDDIITKYGMKAVDMAPLIFLARWAQGQAEKGSIDAKNALSQIKEMGKQWQTGMEKAQLPDTTVSKMRGALEERAYTPPVTPLTGKGDVPVTANAPTPFNPYKTGQMGGGVSPELLAAVKNIAQGNTQNATNTAWGSNNLMNQLALRGGQRGMSGQLTPLQLPTGNTNLFPNIRPMIGTATPAQGNPLLVPSPANRMGVFAGKSTGNVTLDALLKARGLL